MTPHEITILLYNVALLPVVFFSVLFFLLALHNLASPQTRIKNVKTKHAQTTPTVTIQIPSFNDVVAVRCIEACRKLRYPRAKIQIMVLDDSTDANVRKQLQAATRKAGGEYIHRTNRSGYKPGALQEAMPLVRGEVIVIFDADFIPAPDFLTHIMEPFADPKVAIVQGRQGFINKDTNLVTRFAAYTLMVHHTIIMPLSNRANTVLFCGTAGAIRRSAIDAVGGWNTKSITEDSELSVRILSKGYKTVYVPFETPSEVPDTLESFLKQQMRWCYGGLRVFLDNTKTILFSRGLALRQRVIITYLTVGNIIAPVVVVMTVAGMAGWFLGDPRLIALPDLFDFLIKFFYTAGFAILGLVTLYRHKSVEEFPHLLAATFTVSIVLCVANSIAIYRAIFMKDKPLYPSTNNSWICTPKTGNDGFDS